MDQLSDVPAATQDMLRYLSKIGPARREEFFGVFRDVLDQTSDSSMVYGQQAEKRNKSRVTKSRANKKQTSAPSAAKRPLNSFIAFRGYYMPIFGESQQKDISGFLTQLWQADLFQPKWTVIARAYSDIRDQVGKAKAPLNAFLQMVCPEVGIIAPDKYLSDMGWAFFNGQLVRTHIPNSSDFPSNIQSSTLTVSDLVDFAHARSYFIRAPSAQPSTSSSSLMVISHPVAVIGSDNLVSTHPHCAPAEAPEAPRTSRALSQSMLPMSDSDPTMFDARALIEPDLLLAQSGDEYPYAAQFIPNDDYGLNFDPHTIDPNASYDMNLFFDSEAFLDTSLF